MGKMKIAHFILFSIFASSAAVEHGSTTTELRNELEELKNELKGMVDNAEENSGGGYFCNNHARYLCAEAYHICSHCASGKGTFCKDFAKEFCNLVGTKICYEYATDVCPGFTMEP